MEKKRDAGQPPVFPCLSGQLPVPGREIARDALPPLGAAAPADAPHRNETTLRRVLSIATNRGRAGTLELTDRLALSTAGADAGRNESDSAASALARIRRRKSLQ